jgi:hypothetical protein
MVKAVDAQNEQIRNYLFSDDASHHLGEHCRQSLGVSCKAVNGQNKIIDVETTLLKSAASYAVVNESSNVEIPTVPIAPQFSQMPFSVGHWELRGGKSVNTISLEANTRMVEPLPNSHPSIHAHVGDSINLFGVDSRQLIKYN